MADGDNWWRGWRERLEGRVVNAFRRCGQGNGLGDGEWGRGKPEAKAAVDPRAEEKGKAKAKAKAKAKPAAVSDESSDDYVAPEANPKAKADYTTT